jgi:Mg2+ and Co2+ transporter CorA
LQAEITTTKARDPKELGTKEDKKLIAAAKQLDDKKFTEKEEKEAVAYMLKADSFTIILADLVKEIKAKKPRRQAIQKAAHELEKGGAIIEGICMTIVNALKGLVNDVYVRQCLDKKYKSKKHSKSASTGHEDVGKWPKPAISRIRELEREVIDLKKMNAGQADVIAQKQEKAKFTKEVQVTVEGKAWPIVAEVDSMHERVYLKVKKNGDDK